MEMVMSCNIISWAGTLTSFTCPGKYQGDVVGGDGDDDGVDNFGDDCGGVDNIGVDDAYA